MTGRRVATTEAHDPRGAQTFRALTVTFLLLGLAFVALTGGWLLADWRISHRVVLAALGGLVSGVFCAVAAAPCMQAIDGPPDRDDEGGEPDPWTCPGCGRDAAQRCPTYCSHWEPEPGESDDDYDLDDEDDHLPDPWTAAEDRAWEETT